MAIICEVLLHIFSFLLCCLTPNIHTFNVHFTVCNTQIPNFTVHREFTISTIFSQHLWPVVSPTRGAEKGRSSGYGDLSTAGHWSRKTTSSRKAWMSWWDPCWNKNKRAGDVNQWQNACPACLSPWVPSSILKKEKIKSTLEPRTLFPRETSGRSIKTLSKLRSQETAKTM